MDRKYLVSEPILLSVEELEDSTIIIVSSPIYRFYVGCSRKQPTFVADSLQSLVYLLNYLSPSQCRLQ